MLVYDKIQFLSCVKKKSFNSAENSQFNPTDQYRKKAGSEAMSYLRCSDEEAFL